MTVQEVTKAVMKVTGMTQNKIAEKAGLAGQSTVSMYLKSRSMRVEALVTLLNACGYELVARSADGRYPDFVIGDSAERKVESEEAKLRAMVRRMIAEEMGSVPRSGKED